jgi:hypothetical protein
MPLRAALIAPLLAVALVAAPPTDHSRAQSNLPQAFLLGSWTGGLFPAPAVLSAGQCLQQPTVIFTRDLVLRATLTDEFYVQRLIETARGTGNGIDFRFTGTAPPAAAPSLSPLGNASTGGFGCEDPNVLHVLRISPNQIRFPGCADFPFPLVRCPAG